MNLDNLNNSAHFGVYFNQTEAQELRHDFLKCKILYAHSQIFFRWGHFFLFKNGHNILALLARIIEIKNPRQECY